LRGSSRETASSAGAMRISLDILGTGLDLDRSTGITDERKSAQMSDKYLRTIAAGLAILAAGTAGGRAAQRRDKREKLRATRKRNAR